MSGDGLDALADKMANQHYENFAKRKKAEGKNVLPFTPQKRRVVGTVSIGPNERNAKPLVFTSGEFIAGFVPPDYLLDGIVQRRYVYSLTGQTGSGKTAVLLLLTAMVAQGLPFGSAATEQGRVLYLAGENPEDVKARWITMADQMGFDAHNIDVHFIPGVFKISEQVDAIAQAMGKLGGASLVIIDTSATYFEGNEENDNPELLKHAKMFRQLTEMPGGPTVIAACHPAKNAGNDNLVPRGGGAFVNEMDGNLVCKKFDSRAEIHWHLKHRGVNFEPINIEMKNVFSDNLRDSRGRRMPTIMAASLSEKKAQEIEYQSRWDENKILESISQKPGISLAGIAEDNGWRLSNGEPHKTKVQRGIKRLEAEKFIYRKRGKLRLTKEGRDEVESVRNDPVKAAKE